jgi:antitoxin (DNA-binding transcriptional repressor) of toxin-antitoxin stability system
MIQITISQARQNLPSVVDRALAGEEFVILRNRMPVVKISAVGKNKKVIKRRILPEVFGMWKNRWPKSKSSEDIVNEWRKEVLYGKYGS